MNNSKSPPLARRLLAVLALLAFGAVSLHAEDAFVTSYTGASTTGNPPFNYGTGISTFGTSSVGTASPTPPARTRAMYGYQNGTNAWVSTRPTVLTSGPGSWYKMYVLRGTDGNAPSDVIVNITTPDGILLDTSGAVQTAISSTAFRAASGAVNNWLFVGTISNLTTKTPTITWAYASGTQSATGGRCYFDAFRFFYDDPCAIYTQVGISGAVYAGQTVVNVSGVVAGATNVTVFANGTQIGTTNYPAGFAAGTVAVPTSALVKGTVIKAQQSAGACVSGMPGSGPMVGGGANPSISVSLGCWKNSAWTGPVGVNAPSGFTQSYFVKATGLVNNYGTAPVGGYELVAGPCWQEVTFNQQVDPCLDQSTSTALVNSDAYCALESLTFSMDAADSGPYDIYVDGIMNGTTVIEDFEGRATDAGVTFSSPNAASLPSASAYYNTTATNSSLVSTNYAFDGTNACRVQWQFSDNSNIRWAHVLASRATGKTYPELDVRQPVTVKFLVLPAGVTTAHKFNGTVGVITNASVSYAGGTNTFGVPVTGAGSFTYQWYSDSYGGFINGATDRTFLDEYLPTTPPFPMTNNYTVTVSDGPCTETRTLAVIVQPPLPIIINQPVSSVVNVGSAAPAPLSVLAGALYPTGLPSLSYQWEFLGNSPTNAPTAVGPATTAALGDGITSAALTDSGYYHVIAKNSFGSVTSSIVSMQVVDGSVVVGTGTGLRGDYYNNGSYTISQPPPAVSFAGVPALTRTDATINYDWGNGSPGSAINPDYFTARWRGQVQAPIADTYTFTARTDDGVRVWVDKQLIIDSWLLHAPTDTKGTILLNTSKHDILMEYFEKTGGAAAQLSWSNSLGTISESFVPVEQLTPASVAYAVPTIGLTAPANGSSVTLPTPVSLSANVTTNDAFVAKVTFSTNGTLLATVTTSPYTYSWSPAAAGTYAISAQVLYNASANGANPSSMAVSSVTNTVTVLAVTAAPVTISNIVNNLNSTVTINYGGGNGSTFILVKSADLKLTRDAWTPVLTNNATPGAFTPTTTGNEFYSIESK